MKISALIWIYHTELWFEFLPILKQNNLIPVVGLCNENNNELVIQSITENFKEYKIQFFDNKGSDIWSFLNQIVEEENPIFIKIHTKLNNEWRNSLINPIFNNLQSHIDLLKSETVSLPWGKVKNDIGMIASKNHIVNNFEWKNSEKIKEICNILEIDYEVVKFGRYVSGTMFISRTEVFKKYFNKEIINEISNVLECVVVKDKEFGTFTHSLERIFGYIITNEKMRIKSIL